MDRGAKSARILFLSRKPSAKDAGHPEARILFARPGFRLRGNIHSFM
jgi:hypothetical protein